MKKVQGRQWAWLGLVTICLVYGGFALIAGAVELMALVGGPDLGGGGKVRAVPPVFVVHALAGGIALMVGAVQFNRLILRAHPTFHRWAGRTYVVGIWITSHPTVADRRSRPSADELEPSTPGLDHAGPATLGVG